MGLLRLGLLRLAHTIVAGLALVLTSASLSACSSANTSPSDPTYSSSDLQARAEYLKNLAEQAGIADPPQVDLIRFVSAQEWAEVHIDCMTSAGFPVSLLPDGEGIDTSGIPEAQRFNGGPFQLARYECEAKYSIDPGASAQLSDDQLGVLYDWYVDVSAPCLESQGVDVIQPPSKQAFIETYFTDQGWYPYAAIDALTMPDDEWTKLNAVCPQAPEESLLAG